jgi:5-methylcytosine-specific restriction endonuclease McrA
MPLIFERPAIPPGERHRDSLWVRGECYRFYVEQRQRYCTYLEILDLWLQAPYCQDCIWSDPFRRDQPADIGGDGWQVDMLLTLANGVALAETTEEHLREDSDYAFQCKRCQCDLRPWNGDQIRVVNYHLEDHYGIDLKTAGKIYPSKKIRKRIIQFYDRKCFRCGSSGPLHIDHIRARASGGDSAFRNLQPLCEACGQLKADGEPTEIEVFNPLYFTSPPSDSWEHLFW